MTGSSVHQFFSKILPMEMAMHILCSVQCGGLCEVEVALTILKLTGTDRHDQELLRPGGHK